VQVEDLGETCQTVRATPPPHPLPPGPNSDTSPEGDPNSQRIGALNASKLRFPGGAKGIRTPDPHTARSGQEP
jgi:hypothetical protein